MFEFLNPIELCVLKDDGMYTSTLWIEHSPLEIQVFGRNIEDLKCELDKQVCYLWDAYAQEEDDNLSPRALEVKNSLLAVMSELSNA